MLVHLARQQVIQRDLALLLLGVARQLDDLHAVEQRTRNSRKIVRRREEHDIGQVERQLDIVVAERDVLFGVEHLEHRGGRVSAEIAAHLVDLVEQVSGLDVPARRSASMMRPGIAPM